MRISHELKNLIKIRLNDMSLMASLIFQKMKLIQLLKTNKKFTLSNSPPSPKDSVVRAVFLSTKLLKSLTRMFLTRSRLLMARIGWPSRYQPYNGSSRNLS